MAHGVRLAPVVAPARKSRSKSHVSSLMAADMKDYLAYVCTKRNVSVFIVFNEAYRAHYHCVGNVVEDLAAFVSTGTLPHYVTVYLEDIRDRPFL